MTEAMSEDLPSHAVVEFRAAEGALAEAELLLSHEHFQGAVSRAYYAIFHAARAVLNLKGSAPITHHGVISEFGKLCIKAGVVEERYSEILRRARDERQVADYEAQELELISDAATARSVVHQAQEFIERMRKLIPGSEGRPRAARV